MRTTKQLKKTQRRRLSKKDLNVGCRIIGGRKMIQAAWASSAKRAREIARLFRKKSYARVVPSKNGYYIYIGEKKK